MDQLVTNYKVYRNGSTFLGNASVTMPTLTAVTQTINGAGISGNLEVPVQGHYDTMSMTINFRTNTKESLVMSAPCMHQLTLVANVQHFDNATGQLTMVREKHVMNVMPKSHNAGTMAPASQTNGSGEYAVHRWLTYIDGKKIRHIDPANMKCEVNGKDYLAKERKNLGK